MTQGLGPVSDVLEARLRTQAAREGIVIWLDEDARFTRFVDRLIELRGEQGLPYHVQAFRGSYLNLMLALGPLADGVDKPHLVLHLPGMDADGARASPMLELFAVGKPFEVDLPALISEAANSKVLPSQLAVFLERDPLTLEAADTWLTEHVEGQAHPFAASLRARQLSGVVDDLLAEHPDSRLHAHLSVPDDLAVLWRQIEAWTGLPEDFRRAASSARRDDGQAPRGEPLAFITASWALCVEYVHDLRRAPLDAFLDPAGGLPAPVVETCCAFAQHLRSRHPVFYQRTADETESRLVEEVARARAEDLGRIDTFRFEEDMVLKAALKELGRQHWAVAREWAERRLGGSFWLGEDPSRRSVWQLVRGAADLGQAVADAGPSLGAADLAQAVDAYVERGAPVDRAHRHLEQRRAALLFPQLPELETLRERLDGLRRLWRDWADAWARDFNRLCHDVGFLPEPALRQRALFDDVVGPMAQKEGATAYFVVDALRYEMGEELYGALSTTEGLSETEATTVSLGARLAELPTITFVGMNVLAPVAQHGRLRVHMEGGKFLGFSAGEYRVRDPETRKRAMHARVGGETCPSLSLEDVVSRDVTSLKQSIARARLMVVHSREADNAGEKGIGPVLFDHVLQQLRAAWHRLRDAGVSRFVITADHGFLLLDETTRSVQSHGRKIDPKRRHVISSAAAAHRGEVRVELADLAYDGAAGHLMFPETTAVFDVGRKPLSFVHGGNSLQERLIPVLTLTHRSAAGATTLRYTARAEPTEGSPGMHAVKARVDVADQSSLDFVGPDEIELALRVPDWPDVRLELCETRGEARLAGGLAVARVGREFELYFRLLGGADARVLVELFHPTGAVDVEPCRADGRFAVTPARSAPAVAKPPAVEPSASRHAWLDAMPSAEIRQFFEHLAAHGTVTEAEAVGLLGGQRQLRRFSRRFEELAALAPFDVRIDVVGGVKRYVRAGH